MDPYRLAGLLTSVYANYEEEMLTWLGKQLAQYEHAEHLTLSLTEDTVRARRAAENLTATAKARAITMLENTSDLGIISILTDLEGVSLPRRTATVSPAVYSILGELSQKLDSMSPRILRVQDDMLRMIVGTQSAQSMLIGQPLRRRHHNIWKEFVEHGIRGFTDGSGRNWNLASYVEMASRTTVASAYRAQQQHTMLENDLSLVSVATTADACPVCSEWGGTVLSLDGKPPGQYPVWSPLSGVDELVTIDATIDEARSQGLWHPNCQCAQVPYLPGDVRPEATPYNAEEHKARERQRYYERNIRRLKREKLVDPDHASIYNKRIRRHQANIRTLVDDHGLNRKSEREQINHGYKEKQQ